jgi:carboxyl-terminal processing protease
MKFKRIRNVLSLLALLSVVSLISFSVGKNNSGVVVSESGDRLNLTLMWRVRNDLKNLFLEKDKLIDKKMEYGAIKGMVASLDDPYTVFLDPEENKSLNENLAGEFGGVGISLGYKDEILAVVAPLKDTPADKAGVKAGDLIVHIKDEANNVDRDTKDISLNEAVSLIRGKIGSEVLLKIYREGETDYLSFSLKREKIAVPSISLEWREEKGKKIAVLYVAEFTETLFADWTEKVNEIVSEKKKGNFGGIVLDLRNNPGGYLEASTFIASDFIKEGIIVTEKFYDGKEEHFRVKKGRGNLLEDKVVVIINEGSASASEILAGALSEYERVKLVGKKSFGKGTIQQPKDFSDGSGLHVTIAKWLLPSGKNIHGEGITPDVEVDNKSDSNKDTQLEKAIEVLLEK